MACTNWYQSRPLAMVPEARSTDRYNDIERRLDAYAVAIEATRVQLEQHTADICDIKHTMSRIENCLQELNGIIKNLPSSGVEEQQRGSTGSFVRQPLVQFGAFQQLNPMVQLKQLCQATMTVDEYIEAFDKLLTETDISEDAAMNCFLGGLRTDIQSAVNTFKLSSLGSLMQMARIQERSMRVFRATVSSTAKGSPALFLSTPSINPALAASSHFSSVPASKFTGPSPFLGSMASTTTPKAGIDNPEYNTYDTLDSAFASWLPSSASTSTLTELLNLEVTNTSLFFDSPCSIQPLAPSLNGDVFQTVHKNGFRHNCSFISLPCSTEALKSGIKEKSLSPLINKRQERSPQFQIKFSQAGHFIWHRWKLRTIDSGTRNNQSIMKDETVVSFAKLQGLTRQMAKHANQSIRAIDAAGSIGDTVGGLPEMAGISR